MIGGAKRFGASTVLDDVNLTVPEGSITAILGRSGSGKTTLLRIIAGFDRLDSGSLFLDGRVVDDGSHGVSAQHRGVGYVPQDGALFPNLTALGNVAFGLPRRDRDRAETLLELVGLGGLGDRRPSQLSGGQQQRVALARALAVRPSVVLLDEPFSSLDASMRVSVREDIGRVLAEIGTTTIIVTHDQDEALSMADQVALLEDGRILAAAPPRELYSRPANRAVATSLGEVNILPATLTGSSATCVLGTVALTSGADASNTDASNTGTSNMQTSDTPVEDGVVLVRSENVEVHERERPGNVEARVTRFDFYGHDSLSHLVIDDDQNTEIVARLAGDRALQVGQRVWLGVRGAAQALPTPSQATPAR
jgi:iron(III) transport system ATP-binding protein